MLQLVLVLVKQLYTFQLQISCILGLSMKKTLAYAIFSMHYPSVWARPKSLNTEIRLVIIRFSFSACKEGSYFKGDLLHELSGIVVRGFEETQWKLSWMLSIVLSIVISMLFSLYPRDSFLPGAARSILFSSGSLVWLLALQRDDYSPSVDWYPNIEAEILNQMLSGKLS